MMMMTIVTTENITAVIIQMMKMVMRFLHQKKLENSLNYVESSRFHLDHADLLDLENEEVLILSELLLLSLPSLHHRFNIIHR